MTDHPLEQPREAGGPVPRDPQDQQAHEGEDPWDAPSGRRGEHRADDDEEIAEDVPDTDVAGTGRRGAPRSGSVHPERPVPDEPSA
ncbi:hypothetical protein ACL02U_26210 [Streptomyces sp. MS06]|uniref:hypothetical protein n=1 Tax=Streptomyces sp. MS06 TaxID=3385974 RepID=UPI0039A24DEE